MLKTLLGMARMQIINALWRENHNVEIANVAGVISAQQVVSRILDLPYSVASQMNRK